MARPYTKFLNKKWIFLLLPILLMLAPKTLLVLGQGTADDINVVVTETDEMTTVPSTSTLPPPAASLKERPLRLPNSSFPLEYNLHIVTNIHAGGLYFKGNVTIDIEIRETTDEIVLHAKNLSNFIITATEMDSGDMLRDLTYSVDNRRHFLIIHGEEYYQIFEVGKRYRLEILYDGTMNEDHLGLYWLAYRDAGNKVIYQAATQFEPTSARLAIPCYDEPAFKANFTIQITHGKIYSAISNMPMKEVIHHNDSDLSTTIFHTTPPISTYLVAFVVSNFGYISKRQGHVTQRVFTPTMSANKGEHQLEFAIRTVAAIEEYLGVDYALDKLDHVALNKNYGAAMENWGLITYREDCLLYSEDDLRQRFRDTITIVHEIVHQWFGNLVSPEWWSYAWLNEGFATYLSHVIIDMLHPEFKPLEYFIMDTAYRAYSYHKYSTRWRAMTHYVEEEKDIAGIFDLIGYQKAACVIKMFHHAFGEKTFMRGIQQYLKKYQYSVANEMDLFGCLLKALEQSEEKTNLTQWIPLVPEIMLSWTHSKQVPIIKVIRNYENNTVTLVQQQRASYAENLWIPLNFASSSDHDFHNTAADYFMPPVERQVLNVSELGIILGTSDWLIVNKQQTGFYHVLYDDENLRRIAMALQENHLDIHEFNRADIFYCLQPLLDHNEVENVNVIFELLSYLNHEEELLVWNFVQTSVELFGRHLDNTAPHEHYKQFVRHLVRPIYLKYFPSIHEARQAISEEAGSEHTSRQNILKMACQVDLTECLDYARQLAFDYIFQQIEFVTSKEDFYVVTGDVLCYGLKYLTDDEFHDVVGVLVNTNHDTMFFDDIIIALRCTQNPVHIRLYLDMIIGPNATEFIVNPNDSALNVKRLSRTNVKSRSILRQYIANNYRSLMQQPYFTEIFNIMAEYVPITHSQQFRSFHELISKELKIAIQQNYTETSIFHLFSSSSRLCNKNVPPCLRRENLYARHTTVFEEIFLPSMSSQYSVANEMDLFGCLQKALEQSEEKTNLTQWIPLVPEIMLSWTHSKQVPIIKVIRNYENNTVTLVQQQRASYAENLWIPLNFASSSDHDFHNTAADYFMPPVERQVLNVSELGIILGTSDWLIVNKQQTGFYHVLYDDENLRRIAMALQENHLDIHEFNRADIFYCLQPLLDHNEVENVNVIFELLSYLNHEEELLVWNFVQTSVELFGRHLDNTAPHEHYKQFVRHLVRPIYLKYFPSIHEARQAISEEAGSEHTSRQNILKMACQVDLTECLDYARQLAFDYIFQQIEFVTSKEDFYVVTGDVLCYGLKYLTDDEFHDVVGVLVNTNHDTMFFDDIIIALRCTQNPVHIRLYLDMIIGPNATEFIVNPNDSALNVKRLSRTNVKSRSILRQYIANNYRSLMQQPYFTEIFNIMAEYVPTTHSQQFRSFHELISKELKLLSNKVEYNAPLIESNSQDIGKQIKMTESFLDKFEADIYEWLTRHQRPMYAASLAPNRNSAQNRFGPVLRLAGNLYRKLFKNKT
ncbi:aminopeptidase N [Musca autumnalis]|uniref:aminopeptidase N n=1 Tax=Musca autumnalis TaxID=221902 RepID=UPI003CF49FF9